MQSGLTVGRENIGARRIKQHDRGDAGVGRIHADDPAAGDIERQRLRRVLDQDIGVIGVGGDDQRRDARVGAKGRELGGDVVGAVADLDDTGRLAIGEAQPAKDGRVGSELGQRQHDRRVVLNSHSGDAHSLKLSQDSPRQMTTGILDGG